MQLQLIIGLITAVVAAIAAYYVLRFLKGSVKLQPSQSSAKSGEPLSGKVSLEIKKPTSGLLKVSLVGREKQVTQGSSSSGSSTRMVEVYRDNMILEEFREFSSGFCKDYPFDLTAPSRSETHSGLGVLSELAGKTGNAIMDNVLKVATDFKKKTASRIYWHLEAHLDAEGIDLVTKEKVQIHLQG